MKFKKVAIPKVLREATHFFSTASHSRTFAVLTLLLLVAVVPLTVYVGQQTQELRQQAATAPGEDPEPPGGDPVPPDPCDISPFRIDCIKPPPDPKPPEPDCSPRVRQECCGDGKARLRTTFLWTNGTGQCKEDEVDETCSITAPECGTGSGSPQGCLREGENPSECPTDNECKIGLCTNTSICVYNNKDEGTSCSGGTCDGDGNCRSSGPSNECDANNPCSQGKVCRSNKCVDSGGPRGGPDSRGTCEPRTYPDNCTTNDGKPGVYVVTEYKWTKTDEICKPYTNTECQATTSGNNTCQTNEDCNKNLDTSCSLAFCTESKTCATSYASNETPCGSEGMCDGKGSCKQSSDGNTNTNQNNTNWACNVPGVSCQNGQICILNICTPLQQGNNNSGGTPPSGNSTANRTLDSWDNYCKNYDCSGLTDAEKQQLNPAAKCLLDQKCLNDNKNLFGSTGPRPECKGVVNKCFCADFPNECSDNEGRLNPTDLSDDGHFAKYGCALDPSTSCFGPVNQPDPLCSVPGLNLLPICTNNNTSDNQPVNTGNGLCMPIPGFPPVCLPSTGGSQAGSGNTLPLQQQWDLITQKYPNAAKKDPGTNSTPLQRCQTDTVCSKDTVTLQKLGGNGSGNGGSSKGSGASGNPPINGQLATNASCAVTTNSSAQTPNLVTYFGVGGTVKVWAQTNTPISNPTNSIWPYNGTQTYGTPPAYLLESCEGAHNPGCGNSFNLTAPAGNYTFFCDVNGKTVGCGGQGQGACSAKSTTALLVSGSSLAGEFKTATCQTFAGWAKSLQDANASLTVKFVLQKQSPNNSDLTQDVELGTVTANSLYNDIPFNDKNHGFSFNSAKAINGNSAFAKKRDVTAFATGNVQGQNVTTSLGIKTVTCGAAANNGTNGNNGNSGASENQQPQFPGLQLGN